MDEKGEAKQEVERLVQKFKRFQTEGQLSRLGEEETKKTFITPLFRALGWDVENDKTPDEVINEEKVSRGRVDYSFRINSIPKFFLEAKALNKGIDEVKDAAQAINYSWHKGTSWAVLTDFKSLMVYNAEVKGKDLADARFLTFSCDEFLDRFDALWLLSRSAFQAGLLDKEARDWGKKLRKTKVDEQLLQELMRYREALSKNIMKNNANRNLSEQDIDEAVQRIIDRLIFIRTTEDRRIEPPLLLPAVREFEQKKHGRLTESLNMIYRHFDYSYDSRLFTYDSNDTSKRHLCESLEIDNEILIEVIEGLHKSKEGLTYYDFSAIDADVLGNIYEQYLSHILRKTKKRAKVETKEAHRKEQGIYYTPTYIVDYIVRNTLGEVLKSKKPAEVDKLKVLDMACGSGSFLLRAFDMLDKYYQTQGGKYDNTKKYDKAYSQARLDVDEKAMITQKTKILLNNSYGVDLDPKAVEIAQLNLLLKTAETRHRLPDLCENVKCGNSLIDDKAIAGKNAFNWDNEFPSIMSKGGFDVIIGNPPWVSFGLRDVGKIDKDEASFYRSKYSSAEYKLSTYPLFVERAIKSLAAGGYLSFILPDSFLLGRYFSKLRRVILDNCEIKSILLTKYDVFSGKATTGRNVVIVLRKTSGLKKGRLGLVNVLSAASEEDFRRSNFSKLTYPQNYFEKIVYNRFRLFFDIGEKQLVEKIEAGAQYLGDFMVGHTGVRSLTHQKEVISKSQRGSTWKAGLISGSQIGRYWLRYDNDYLNIDPNLLNKGGWDPNVVLNDKIMIRQTGDRLYATIDCDKYYHLNNIHSFNLKSTILSMKYILALLNSKMMSAYYLLIALEKDRVMAQTDIETLEKLPIRVIDDSEQKKFVELVDGALVLNKRRSKLADKQTDELATLEKEIAESDRKIDELVYDLYGLGPEERRIVEEAVK